MHLVKGRNAIIPFQKRTSASDLFDRIDIHLPHGINDGIVVRIESTSEFRVASNMNLAHTMVWMLFRYS